MFKLLKPKILEDVRPRDRSLGDVFRSRSKQLNLSYVRTREFPVTRLLKVISIGLAISFFIIGSVTAPTTATLAANDGSDDEREALEVQLRDLEKQIDGYEDQIVGYQKQGKTLKNEISTLQGKISKLNLQIKAINLSIGQLDKKIDETQYQISETEENIDTSKESLASLLRDLHEREQASLVEVFLKSPRLSDFFNDLNNIMLIQNNLQVTITKISDLKNKLEDQKEQLSVARSDQTTLKGYQESQKGETEKLKGQKNNLLEVTKGQESKYQNLLKETKKTAAEIRSRIFKLLGGGELSFEEAYKFAKLAGQSTGIDPALILAVLDRESALGKNVGRCDYKKAMHPTRDVPIFLDLLKELGLSPDSTAVLVSCANKDGAYGGAMGPAQFIPSTWKLYKDEVARVTGNNPANPWNNSDAFVATALYLKDAMRQCSSYSNKASQERCAAARYYAGGNWKRHLWTYGEGTVARAQRFREDIEAITS